MIFLQFVDELENRRNENDLFFRRLNERNRRNDRLELRFQRTFDLMEKQRKLCLKQTLLNKKKNKS